MTNITRGDNPTENEIIGDGIVGNNFSQMKVVLESKNLKKDKKSSVAKKNLSKFKRVPKSVVISSFCILGFSTVVSIYIFNNSSLDLNGIVLNKINSSKKDKVKQGASNPNLKINYFKLYKKEKEKTSKQTIELSNMRKKIVQYKANSVRLKSNVKELSSQISGLEEKIALLSGKVTKLNLKVGSLEDRNSELLEINNIFNDFFNLILNGDVYVLKDLDLNSNGIVDSNENLILYQKSTDSFYSPVSLLNLYKGTPKRLISGEEYSNRVFELFRKNGDGAGKIESNSASVKYTFSLRFDSGFLGTKNERDFDENVRKVFVMPDTN